MSGDRFSFPFRRIPKDVIEVSEWFWTRKDSTEKVLVDSIPDWDYSVDLGFRREIKVDIESILSAIGLESSGARLELVVTLVTGAQERFRTVVWRQMMPSQGEASIEPNFRLSGSGLSKRIVLRSEIILASDQGASGALAPSRSGSRLWEDSCVGDLEGTLGRFPLEVLDFGEVFPDMQTALWYLDWDPNHLDNAFLGSVRLCLNCAQVSFMDRFRQEDPIVLSLVLSGIIFQMTVAALGNDEFCDRHSEFEDHTVGSVISSWLESAYPGELAKTIAEDLEVDPGRFAARVSEIVGAAND